MKGYFVFTMGGSPGDVSEEHVTWEKRKKRWRVRCDVTSPTSQVILQPFRRFTYATAHSPTLPSLHLRHNSLSYPSVASPTSQLTLQPFCCFTYVTAHSPTLPLLHLRHGSHSNLSVASPTSQHTLQRFFRFSHVTGSSLTSPGEPPVVFTTT